MWFNKKPKTELSGCLAMFLLVGMATFGFTILIIMAIMESIFSK